MVSDRAKDFAYSQNAEVVCFGMVVPATLLIVDELPAWNTGVVWKHVSRFISDDAVIVATLLRKWGVQTGLICTAMGDDEAGRNTVKQLWETGILGDFRLLQDISTPYELNISDSTGGRTYFWRRDPAIMNTLDTADLSLIDGARMLYADWYDGSHVLRALKEASRLGVPVFFNFEHGHEDSELLARYAPYISVCQAVTDFAQLGDNSLEVASKLLNAGVSTALVTMAERGCLAATQQESVRVYAPDVNVIDGCAAGATFSAGYVYGLVNGWDMETRLRFAVAAASLQCTAIGPTAFPVDEIRELGSSLAIENGPSPIPGM